MTERRKKRPKFFSALKSNRGQSMVEYSLILVLIAIAVATAVKTLGTDAKDTFTKISNTLEGK